MSHPNETRSYYVTVANGRAQLRSSARTGVIQTFGSNIETAIVQGQAIIATSSKGVTYEYAIQNNYAILKRTFWREEPIDTKVCCTIQTRRQNSKSR